MKNFRTKTRNLALASIMTALLAPLTVSAATSQTAPGHTAANQTRVAPPQITSPQVAPPQPAAPLPNRACDITITPRIAPACPGDTTQAIGTSNYDAARADNGNAVTAIDAWGYCRYVDSSATDHAIFVPFRSQLEWKSFVSFAPSFIKLVACARPGTVAVPINYPTYPNGQANPWYNAALSCEAATVQNVDITNYGRADASAYTAPQFAFAQQCTVKGMCDVGNPKNCSADQKWTLSAIATFTAGPDNDPPATHLISGGWKLTNVVYVGNKPQPNLPVINGACGMAKNTCVSGTPGTPANTATGTSWICDGMGGGRATACNVAISTNAACGSKPGACASGVLDAGGIKEDDDDVMWQCDGTNGSKAFCSSPLTDGSTDTDQEAGEGNLILPSTSNLHATCGTSVGPGRPVCSDGQLCVAWTNTCDGSSGTTCYRDASCN